MKPSTSVNTKPMSLTKGLKSTLNEQVDYINANFHEGRIDECEDMLHVMIQNLKSLRSNFTIMRFQREERLKKKS